MTDLNLLGKQAKKGARELALMPTKQKKKK